MTSCQGISGRSSNKRDWVFIYLFNPFSNSLYKHTTGCKIFHAFWRTIVIIYILYILIPILQLYYSFFYLQ